MSIQAKYRDGSCPMGSSDEVQAINSSPQSSVLATVDSLWTGNTCDSVLYLANMDLTVNVVLLVPETVSQVSASAVMY